MANDLLDVMSVDELVQFKAAYPNNESLAKIVDGYIEVKRAEEARVEAKAKFETGIAKMVAKLPHPDDIYNVYLRWAEVEEAVGEPEVVEVPLMNTETGRQVVGEEGKLMTTTEMRQPTTKVWKWVVETNKAFPVVGKATSGGSGNGSPKRAITVKRLEPDNTVTVLGTFDSGADFCRTHGIDYTNNSPIRALKSAGYLPFLASDGKAI